MPNAGVRAAVEAVGTAESALGLAAADGEEFHVGKRTAHRPSVADLPLAQFADPLVRNLTPTSERITATCHSDVIATGKFDRAANAKARGYLVLDGQSLSLKAWRADGQPTTDRRLRRARAKATGIPHYRAPEVLASGEHAGISYVLEPTVFGRHPSGTEERCAAAADLLPNLVQAYHTHGISHRRLGRVVHRSLPDRLTALLEAGDLPWDAAWGCRRRLLADLLRLVDRDRAVPCAYGHGDLVASNIIRTPDGGHRLIDWEFAKAMPIAFDLGKLLFTSGEPETMTARLADDVRTFSGTGRRRYSWRDQLALGIANFLSHSAHRRERAREAGLLHVFDRELAQRLRWLSTLVN